MAEYRFTAGGVGAALAALGYTDLAVANALWSGGHIGLPDNECGCPVALYLMSLYPGATCSVTEEQPDALAAEVYYPDGRSVVVLVPSAAYRFVRRYDAGDFPELDARSAVA